MKKDSIRDYATEAFRFYASCGRLTSEQIKEKIYKEIYEQSKKEFGHCGIKGFSDSTAYAVLKAEEAMTQMQAEFEDILAVERTLAQVNRHIKKAVEIEMPASERSIYYWLRKARIIFAEERGLRYR